MRETQIDPLVKHETRYCVPLFVRDEQIRSNIKKVTGRIEQGVDTDEPCAIVGYGPSLADTWEELKNFKTIFTCSGSHKFLLSKGIIPTYHCEVDPREHKIELLGTPHKDVTYFPASCIHPKYIKHLQDAGANIKLWHVFASDGESEQVIPRGEYMVTGGCDVGMRSMTIARFMGYKNLHIFGMDGSEGKTGKHAAAHPNQPKQSDITIVNGKEFRTTHALLESAKMVFHELDQLKDVDYHFYGDGMIQEMAKTYVRQGANGSVLAAQKPILISDEMRGLNSQLHQDNPYYGSGGSKYAETVIQMKTPEITSILDYGCGKSQLAKSLPFPIWQYDPAIPEHSEPPRPADLVICTDVLEHIEKETLDAVLDDLRRVTVKVGYFVIHIGPAKKVYADGRNAHLIQETPEWWVKKLQSRFEVATSQMKGNELHCVVGQKVFRPHQDPVVGIKGQDGIKSRFYIPNETCKWRAETLLSKEPVTIDWIQSMPKGSVLWDIGANVGGYSVWAGVRGIQVYSFEPEAENYALLCRNLSLNKLPCNAYPLAITNSLMVDSLKLSQRGLGGSCHSFGESGDVTQGAVGMTIDSLVAMGIPKPDFIKIDVDGIEPKIIEGAKHTLKSVKGLLVEVDPSKQEHKDMLGEIASLGFLFDEAQVKQATRKEGKFVGVAEHVFFRQSETEKYIINAINQAELKTSPFPYFVVENVLPSDVYLDLLSSLPKEGKPIKEVRGLNGYPERYVIDFARPEWMACFKKSLMQKFGIKDCSFSEEHLLINDKPGYHIGPHTDVPARVLSAILYMTDKSVRGLGTHIYTPKKPGFTETTGKHFEDSKDFHKHFYAEYKPNSMLVFMRTNNSFHGVEKTNDERTVLLYDIRKP